MKNGKFVLFRMPDSGTGTENTIDDKIEFDEGAMVPDGNSKLAFQSFTIGRHRTENNAPFSDTGNFPDTGFAGVRIEFNLVFNEQESTTTALGIGKLIRWSAERNVVRGSYRRGSIGMRNDYRPEFNVTPTNNFGYKIVHFNPYQDFVNHSITKANLVIQSSGDPRELGV